MFCIIHVFMFLLIDFHVLHIIQVFNTPSFDHSHLNEFHDMPRGSSDHSNHPNDDMWYVLI
jgi:hypothetical protein